MGSGFDCTCNNCGYGFSAHLGVGMYFPHKYEECIEKMKVGEYGKQGKDFFDKFPNGAIDCYEVVAYCKNCGEFHQITDLTMYLPKEGYNLENNAHDSRWSVAFPLG